MRLSFLIQADDLTGGNRVVAMADPLVQFLSEPASAWCRRSLQAYTRAHAYWWVDATKRFLALLNFHANVVSKEGQEHV
jgi:hypothetical protein